MTAPILPPRHPSRRALCFCGEIVAWGWTVIAGGGGFGLLVLQGPWPPTNGWFAFFSGLAACPLTAWLLRRYRAFHFPGWARFGVALALVVLGRLALKMEGRDTFMPHFQ